MFTLGDMGQHHPLFPISTGNHILPRELLLEAVELSPSALLARDTFLVNAFSLAALTWLVYDMALNFGKEVTLVWKRWHEPKGRHSRRLYMIVRYFSILNLAWYVGVNTSVGLSVNVSSCRAWNYIVVVNTTVITLLPDVMLLIRLNAVYAWRISTLLLTIFLFIIQTTTSLVVGLLSVTQITSSPIDSSIRSIPGCPASMRRPVAQFTLVAWIPSILAQFVYLLFMFNTLAHLMYGLDASGSKPINGGPPATPHARTSPLTDDNHYSNSDAATRKTKLKGKAPQSSTSPAQVDKLRLQSRGRAFSWKALQQVRQLVPTMMVFVGHGGLYFGFAILAKVANAVLLTTQSGPLQAAAIPWMMALYPVLVTRIYLSMVHYLHFGLPMKRPQMLGSYDGPGENYTWIDEGGMVFVDGVSGQWDEEAQEEETDWVDGDAEYLRPWRTRTLDLVPGRMTFAARESLASPSVLDFRDEEY